MTDYCIQAEVEAYLNVTFGANPDAATALWITAASKAIDTFCRHTFDQNADDVELHDGNGSWGDLEYERHNTLFLKNRPVISVSEVQNNDVVMVVTDEYVVYEDKAMIRLVPDTRYFTKKRQGVQVTYTWGYAEVPVDVKDVCIRLVGESLKEMMRFSEFGGANRVSMGGISVSHPSYNSLPDWAQLALKEYVQWGWS